MNDSYKYRYYKYKNKYLELKQILNIGGENISKSDLTIN